MQEWFHDAECSLSECKCHLKVSSDDNLLSEEEIEEENERDEQNQVVRIRSLVPNSEQLEAL